MSLLFSGKLDETFRKKGSIVPGIALARSLRMPQATAQRQKNEKFRHLRKMTTASPVSSPAAHLPEIFSRLLIGVQGRGNSSHLPVCFLSPSEISLADAFDLHGNLFADQRMQPWLRMMSWITPSEVATVVR